MDGFSFLPASLEALQAIGALEAASYPADEAATEEKIQYRIQHANAYFYVLKNNADAIVGFVNGTCVNERTIHHDSMSVHHPQGRTLVIHSVVIDQQHRRQHLATAMLKRYVSIMHEQALCSRILLLSKAQLLPFYMSCGFRVHQLSDVVHGEEKWFELGMDLRDHFGLDQLQVDAFTTGRAFSGNPAAVVFTQGDDVWMQNVAMENNLAETSFLDRMDDSNYKLRWFTPNKEVELCGHATLAAAHALYETGRVLPCSTISFHTLHSGVLTATGKPDGTISLSFPATPVKETVLSSEDTAVLCGALHIAPNDVLFSGRSLYDLMVEIAPAAFAQLGDIGYSALAHFGGRGVIVTCSGGGSNERSAQCDFRSRCFFPVYAINEDPVTGSAHCALAPYWFGKLNRQGELLAFQDSPRGGMLRLSLEDDRVQLSGHCTTTMTMRILA